MPVERVTGMSTSIAAGRLRARGSTAPTPRPSKPWAWRSSRCRRRTWRLLRRIFDGINWGETNEMDLRSFFHPDVEFPAAFERRPRAAYHGIAGIERFVADTGETFEDIRRRT